MFDFISGLPDTLVFVIFVLSMFLACISFIWWFEHKEFKRQEKDWAEFLETGDDYHFLKKGEDDE